MEWLEDMHDTLGFFSFFNGDFALTCIKNNRARLKNKCKEHFMIFASCAMTLYTTVTSVVAYSTELI